MEIRCGKEDCKHNTGCSCNASDIIISKATHCESYECNLLKDKLISENGNIFSVAEDMAPQYLQNVPLECMKKDCIYNKQEACHASGIRIINGDNDDCADCATYCQC